MVQINFAQKQVNAKIVFYGPGMSGKTTNLEVIHQRAPAPNKGELTSISTDGDRTLFFDFMPLDLGTVAGMRTCFQIYTVPGQVYYNSTRKLVLQGVDGVVFVADSSASMIEENLESMRNLEQNLNEYGKSIGSLPVIIQYNKRDLPDALPVDELNRVLNPNGCPWFEAVANTGQGVFPTLKALAAKVLESIHGGQKPAAAPAAAPAPAAAMPAPAPSAPAAVGTGQTGFHSQAAVPAAAAAAARPLTQTGYRAAASVPRTGAGLPPAPSFGASASPEPLARTAIHAPPQNARPPVPSFPQSPAGGLTAAAPAPLPAAHAAPAPSLSMAPAASAPQPAASGLQMHAPRADASHAAQKRATLPTPRAVAAERAAARPAPRSAPQPAPAAKPKSKAALYTTIFVVGALAIGAVVAKVVFSLF